MFGEAMFKNFLLWIYENTELDGISTMTNVNEAESGGVFGVGGTASFVPRFLIACSHVTHLLPAMSPPLITLMFISSTRPSLALLPPYTIRPRNQPLFPSTQNIRNRLTIPGGTRDIFGFGLQTANLPTTQELQNILDAINAWVSEVASGLVVIERPNDFFDLSQIGAAPSKRDNGAENAAELEKRSRTNQCPAKTDLLQYINGDVPDLDINREIRWAGQCDP